jgi:arylsulfatase A-like enzyme
MAGPGIASGSVNSDLVQNIDLAPTFARLARAPFSHPLVDGHSFTPLLHGKHVAWRSLAVVEHDRVTDQSGDPDHQPDSSGRVPSYRALLSTKFTYVQYARGEREYYNRSSDPYELDNIYRTLPHRTIKRLQRELATLTHCSGYTRCWLAAAPT